MSEREELEVLLIDGTAYPTRFPRKYRIRKPVSLPDPREVRAFVPGAVLEVLAEPGQPVERGQALVVVEAMKMQNTIMAPARGVVGEIHVAPGALVEKGDRLVTLA